MRDTTGFCRTLGYEFADPALLEEALTHSSEGTPHNERLEFLGDALLNAVVAAALYRCHPKASEGRLSRLRAALVNQEALATQAQQLGLGDNLRLGAGEIRSGGYRRPSILAGAFEAVIGAIYLDGGFDSCERVILTLFEERAAVTSAVSLKDPKTLLQEWLQSRRLSLPSYRVREVSGEPHEQSFLVECSVLELGRSATGKGSSRRKAEQEAARKLLGLLGHV
jgi:ribonuclease-3